MNSFNAEYFKEYTEQPFKWKFWARYVRRRTTKKANILEIGCGYGYLFKHLKEYPNRYGIDISPHAIEKAKNSPGNYSIMDAEKLEFPDNFFDIVLCIDTLEHLKRPEEALKETARVLKQNGLLLITTPNPESYSHKKKGLKWFAFQDPTHISIHPLKTWKEWLEKNSFHIKKTTTIDLFDFPYATKLFRGINYLLYTIHHPYIPKIGDNLFIRANKEKSEKNYL